MVPGLGSLLDCALHFFIQITPCSFIKLFTSSFDSPCIFISGLPFIHVYTRSVSLEPLSECRCCALLSSTPAVTL